PPDLASLSAHSRQQTVTSLPPDLTFTPFLISQSQTGHFIAGSFAVDLGTPRAHARSWQGEGTGGARVRLGGGCLSGPRARAGGRREAGRTRAGKRWSGGCGRRTRTPGRFG